MALWSDITHGCRLLLKERGFTLAAVLTLSLGIAVNMVVFTLVNGALLRDLPFEHPDRIVESPASTVIVRRRPPTALLPRCPGLARRRHHLRRARSRQRTDHERLG